MVDRSVLQIVCQTAISNVVQAHHLIVMVRQVVARPASMVWRSRPCVPHPHCAAGRLLYLFSFLLYVIHRRHRHRRSSVMVQLQALAC